MSRSKNHTTNFAECRDLGHAWKPLDAKRYLGLFVETLRCTRCEARKDRAFSPKTGELKQVNEHRVYPEGYLKPKGSGRLTAAERAKIRLERLR